MKPKTFTPNDFCRDVVKLLDRYNVLHFFVGGLAVNHHCERKRPLNDYDIVVYGINPTIIRRIVATLDCESLGNTYATRLKLLDETSVELFHKIAPPTDFDRYRAKTKVEHPDGFVLSLECTFLRKLHAYSKQHWTKHRDDLFQLLKSHPDHVHDPKWMSALNLHPTLAKVKNEFDTRYRDAESADWRG